MMKQHAANGVLGLAVFGSLAYMTVMSHYSFKKLLVIDDKITSHANPKEFHFLSTNNEFYLMKITGAVVVLLLLVSSGISIVRAINT